MPLHHTHVADLDDAHLSASARSGIALIGRILMAAIFLMSGIMKFAHNAETAGHMRDAGIPAAELLSIVAGTAEILGAIGLLAGLFTRLAAAGLFLFLIPTTLIFHAFWGLEGQAQTMQIANFMKNLAIMGGLAVLVAFGPGRWSVDARARDPRPPRHVDTTAGAPD
jgi:putative oxidoreductase